MFTIQETYDNTTDLKSLLDFEPYQPTRHTSLKLTPRRFISPVDIKDTV